MLNRIIKPFFSILQRRPRIFKEFFMLGRIIKIFFFQFRKEDPVYPRSFFLLGRIKKRFISSILQRRPRIFKEFYYLRSSFILGRKIKILFFFKSAKLFGPFLIVCYSLNNQPRQLPWLPWW